MRALLLHKLTYLKVYLLADHFTVGIFSKIDSWKRSLSQKLISFLKRRHLLYTPAEIWIFKNFQSQSKYWVVKYHTTLWFSLLILRNKINCFNQRVFVFWMWFLKKLTFYSLWRLVFRYILNAEQTYQIGWLIPIKSLQNWYQTCFFKNRNDGR